MRSIFITAALAVSALLTFSLAGIPVFANPGILGDFESLYGTGMTAKFSCDICHDGAPPKLNAYGDDLANSGGFGCQDFHPAPTHTILLSSGACDALHAAGYQQPMAGTCVGCHGSTLQGGSAPSCYTCHGKVWADGGSGSCPDFQAPADHTISKNEDGCSARHKSGYEQPLSSGCTSCHGGDLRGGATGPSCYTCHGAKWDGDGDDDDAPAASPSSTLRITHASANAAAFKAIESWDSDGDGYSNIEEIDAASNPGDETSTPSGLKVTLKTADTWERKWITTKGYLSIVVTFAGSPNIDSGAPFTLSTANGSLTTANWRLKGSNSIEILYPRAVLYTLLDSLHDAKTSFTLSGENSSGETFSAAGAAKLSGSAPVLLDAVKGTSKPKKVGEGTDVVLRISGADVSDIDITRAVRVAGPFATVKANSVKRSGNAVEVTLNASAVKKMLHTPVEGMRYTVGIRGSSTASGTAFAVPVSFLGTSSGGGGGTTCYDFSPPSSHTVARTTGKCTYYHLPGLTTPTTSGCTSCHGPDLKGSSFAPSCYTCHDKLW